MSDQVIPGYTDLRHTRTRWMQVLGRLNEDVTLKQAQVGLQPWFKAMLQGTCIKRIPKTTPEEMRQYLNSSLTLTAAPQGHSSLRRRLVEPLWVLFAVTAVLLGLACLNVSGLFLARGSARDREISTRLALGASRGRLGRQFLAESLLIALAGGFLGTALAPLAVRALIAFLPKSTTANALHAGVDARLLLFALGASVTAGVLSGLAPAWQSGRRSLVSSLQQRGGSSSLGGVRVRKVIVTAQIALTLTLVVGAALFVRTLDALLTKGPGFVTSSLVSFSLDSLRNGYSKADGSRLIRRIDEAVRDSPITQVSAMASVPLLTGGSWNDPLTIQADKRITTDHDVNLNAVTPAFFRTMGIRILVGRNFDERDVRPAGEKGFRSAIVNESFVKRSLGGIRWACALARAPDRT